MTCFHTFGQTNSVSTFQGVREFRFGSTFRVLSLPPSRMMRYLQPVFFVAAVHFVLSVYWCFSSVFFWVGGCCHDSCYFNLLARNVRLHNTPFAEQKYQTPARLQFIPVIDNHRILWLRNWLRASMGFLRPEAAGGLFVGWLPMGWGVLHTLVSVAILVSVCSLSG